MSAMKKILLRGELAELYGREHLYAVNTPAEALRALNANYQGFNKYLLDSASRGMGFKVRVNKKPITIEQCLLPSGKSDIEIIPVIMGQKKGGFFGILLGAALFAVANFGSVAIIEAGLGSGLSFGQGLSVVSGLKSLGTSLLLGGISNFLSPQPKSQGPIESAQNTPNYFFNGPINTTSQGQPVPIGYGRAIIGSAVISAGVTTEEYQDGAFA